MKKQGFTLVELLVALFITSILFVMGYGAINQALSNRGAIEEQQERLLAVQTTMRLFAQDFGQAASRPVREPIGSTWEDAFVSQAASRGNSAAPQALVLFTRAGWANPAGVQRPTLQRVAYTFEDGILRRNHWPVLDATLAAEPVRRELLKDVRSVTLRFMDGSRQWIEQWPSPTINQIARIGQPGAGQRLRPRAVELTLELEDWGRIVRVFEVPQ